MGTLVGGITHDFNNLLQIVLGYSEIMLQRKKENEPDYVDLVRLRAHSIREVQVLSRYTLQTVANCNCVAVKRGGEQQEVNDQSVG